MAKFNGTIGNDIIRGTILADFMYGGAGSDQLWGGSGDDYIEGNDGNDITRSPITRLLRGANRIHELADGSNRSSRSLLPL